ncbi:phosphosulfolactate synthase [Alicyclobacillus dauci]|uniref:Phosphosulfolactate synthase n=1 Tax=Alicyclobacillus dauci TaxID=1475485 RepID=A0ABY6YZX0_9BACL|nr:phosphosulfolactate synthase [Alicyclobacillus dauci]WAH35516.1 phosphosulfolactate synthase [Alicyclobacillus dauci]
MNTVILSDSGAFSQIIQYPLGKRSSKPRAAGVTMVIDKGLGYEALNDHLEIASSYMDILKLGFGTSCLYPRHILRQKLSLARVYSVHTCPGGTLTEIAITQNVFHKYVERCAKLGFTAMEISDGTIELDADTRLRAIELAKAHMGLVITEVGKKLERTTDMEKFVKQLVADLEAGADYVIVEGRESGENIGIYGSHGEIDEVLFEDFTAMLPPQALSKVMWEAPKKSQQVELIKRFGQSVNLGNIPPSDVIALECLRLGLRSDSLTFTFDNSFKEAKF